MKQETLTLGNKEYHVLIGQNSHENTELVDTSDQKNIWFHVANAPSCHVVLKTECKIRDVPLQVIKWCAHECKSRSKSKSVQNCEIIYTQIENVETTKIPGQVNTPMDKLKFIKI
jgi:predicted ribosome quality control (RQC) complex YloA/Tae2 family protein